MKWDWLFEVFPGPNDMPTKGKVTPEQMSDRIALHDIGSDGNTYIRHDRIDPRKLAEVLAELFNRTN